RFDIKPTTDKAEASVPFGNESFCNRSTGVDIRKANRHVDGNAIGLPSFDDWDFSGREQLHRALRMRQPRENERIRLPLQKGRDQMLLPFDRMVAIAQQRG